MSPETTITCKIGRTHQWVPLYGGRHKCIICKLIIHEPSKK